MLPRSFMPGDLVEVEWWTTVLDMSKYFASTTAEKGDCFIILARPENGTRMAVLAGGHTLVLTSKGAGWIGTCVIKRVS